MALRADHTTTNLASSVALIALVVAAIGLRAAEEPPDVTGFWKLCYEPDLQDLDEPSDGYLALLPDGRYYEVRSDCCGEGIEDAASQTVGLYTLDPRHSRVQLDDDRSFRLRSDVTAVLFDALDSPISGLTALQPGETLDDSYCRVYP